MRTAGPSSASSRKHWSFADEDAAEVISDTGTNPDPESMPASSQQTECTDVLWNFMASIEAHTDTLAVEKGEPVLDLAA